MAFVGFGMTLALLLCLFNLVLSLVLLNDVRHEGGVRLGQIRPGGRTVIAAGSVPDGFVATTTAGRIVRSGGHGGPCSFSQPAPESLVRFPR
jgi:hypothetical protein